MAGRNQNLGRKEGRKETRRRTGRMKKRGEMTPRATYISNEITRSSSRQQLWQEHDQARERESANVKV